MYINIWAYIYASIMCIHSSSGVYMCAYFIVLYGYSYIYYIYTYIICTQIWEFLYKVLDIRVCIGVYIYICVCTKIGVCVCVCERFKVCVQGCT